MAVDVHVVLTKHIQDAILEAIRRNSVPQDLEKQLSKYTKDFTEAKELDKREKKVAIPFKLVKRLWECLRGNTDKDSKLYLHELLAGSEVYVEPLKLPEKSPELIARLKKLKAEQERAEYDRMVSNVDRKLYFSTLGTNLPNCSWELFLPIAVSMFVKFKNFVFTSESFSLFRWHQSNGMQLGQEVTHPSFVLFVAISSDSVMFLFQGYVACQNFTPTGPPYCVFHIVRSVSKQLASIINFLLSIMATFAFGFIASQYAFPSISMRVIIGIVLAFIVAIAELYFMARVEI